MIAVRNAAFPILLGLLMASGVRAATPADYRVLAREILAELVVIDTSTRGVNTTPAEQAVVARLRAAGYGPVAQTPVPGDPSTRGTACQPR